MDALFPPGPQKSLLFGDSSQFKQNPFEFLLQSARAYGDLVHFRFGPSHAYLLTNPRDARLVLVEHFDQFDEKPSLFRALNSAMGHDLFTPKDQVTKKTLRRGVYRSHWVTPLINNAVQSAVPTLDTWTGGNPIPLLETLTLNAVMRTLFGTSADPALVAALADGLCAQRGDQKFQSPLTAPDWIPTARNRERNRATADLKHIVAELLQSQHPYNLFSCLLNAADSQAWAVEEMLALFYAGHQTVAHTLAWAWYLLTQNSEAADSVHAEVDSVLAGRLPTAADLPNLAYCEMVLKETMRLYPPVWLISRQAKKETRLGDYYMPAGSTVFVSPYIVHHSQRYYSTPDRFLPERFMRPAGYSYMPFGAGTYAQVEQDYALTIAKLMLALAAQRFRLSVATPPTSAALSPHPIGLQLQPQRFTN